MLTARSLKEGTISVEIGTSYGNVVKMAGVLRDPTIQSWLWPELQKVHSEAVATRLREVVLDLRDLSYSTADGWRILMAWLRLFRSTSHTGLRLRLIANFDHQWQHVGISTLVIFGGEQLIVETASSGPASILSKQGSRQR